MIRYLVVPLAFAITLASAESNTLTGRPGFFKPTPDGNSSISRIVTPEEAARAPAAFPTGELATAPPIPAAPGTVALAPVVVTPAVTPAAPVAAAPVAREEAPDATARRAEIAMDRADREHKEMTERSVQSATTLQGAYTGLTSEPNR